MELQAHETKSLHKCGKKQSFPMHKNVRSILRWLNSALLEKKYAEKDNINV